MKTRLRKLYDNVITKNTGCILMDDETYIYSDTAQIKGMLTTTQLSAWGWMIDTSIKNSKNLRKEFALAG